MAHHRTNRSVPAPNSDVDIVTGIFFLQQTLTQKRHSWTVKCIKPPSCLWEFKKVNVSCLLVCFLNGWKRQSMMGSRWGRARPSDRKSSTQSLHSSLIMNAYGCLMRGKRRCLNSFGFRPFKPLPCSFPISQTLFPPSRPVSLFSLSPARTFALTLVH